MTKGRLYDTRQWRFVRELQLRREPFCRVCAANGDPDRFADQVDHIKPLERGGAPFDPANLQSLCGPCHSRKTALFDKRGTPWRADALQGCDEHGAPLDPAHSFYAPAGGASDRSASTSGDRAHSPAQS